jgi:hypothetical protein
MGTLGPGSPNSQNGGGSSPRGTDGEAPPRTAFGPYLLLDRIAVGGMAEVFRAKPSGTESVDAILAIKRILPTMAEDHEFIEMFIDEATIAGQLAHPNIARIHELGQIDDAHYIAMEYVWGKDLLQIMNRFRRMRRHMPPVMAAWIATKMLEALDYAHHRRDRTGRPLSIVHRDVSPQNCLISYEGRVKMIDFGIAKAASRNTKTQAGVLKGKFGYLSPEQVAGDAVDRRSDVFAASTCLHEMLTGERLFLGESDFATLERVRVAEAAPPSQQAPNVPSELDDIVLRGLSPDPDDRWRTAGEMRRALQRFVARSRPPFGTSKLRTWMRSAFAAEMAEEKALLERFAEARPQGADEPARPSAETDAPLDAEDLEELGWEEIGAEIEDEDSGDATAVAAAPLAPVLRTPSPRPPGPADLHEVPTKIFGDARSGGRRRPSSSPAGSLPPPPPAGALRSPPPPAPLPEDIFERITSSFPPPPPMAGEVRLDPPPQTPLSPPPPAPDDAAARPSRPTWEPPATGRGALLFFYLPLALVVALGLGFALTVGARVLLDRPSGGTLVVTADPPEVVAHVFVDDAPRGTTPLTLEGIPPGRYAVEIRAEGFREVTLAVEVEAGQRATLMVPLQRAPRETVRASGSPAEAEAEAE